MSTKQTASRTPKTTPRAAVPRETCAAQSRPGAVSSLEMINLFEGALASPTRLQTKVWVRNVAYDKRVWLDVDVLNRTGEPLHSETLPLEYLEPAGGAGDFFQGDLTLRGTVARSARAAAGRRLQYRLYYEVDGQVFTDGLCHQQHL